MVYCANKTLVTTTAGSGGVSAAVTRINRLQSASFGEDTNVNEITEMGAQFRAGGVDDLGEAKVKLDWNDVGIGNLAALTGTTVAATPNTTTTIGLTQLQTATVDLFRIVADSTNTTFKTTYAQDCVINEWSLDIKDKGMAMEGIALQGPVVEDFPGFVVPSVYVGNATDATNGYFNVSPAIGANEQPMPVYQPGPTESPSYWSENGANYFLKIERLPGASLAASPIRYYEYVNGVFQTAAIISAAQYITPSVFIKELMTVGQKVQLETPGSANAEVVTITAVASKVNTTVATLTAGAVGPFTPASMLGIFPGVTLQLANADGSAAETKAVASVTGTTFTLASACSAKTANWVVSTLAPSFLANVTKTHAAAVAIYPFLPAAAGGIGYATYFPSGTKLYIGDTVANGDALRLVFHSYNTDSFPTSIPANTPDTADRPGISYRVVPLAINGNPINRGGISSVSFKFSLKRDHANGVGEKTIVYGVPSVPDVSISLDAKEKDATMLALLLTGSKNLTAQGASTLADNQEYSSITRRGLKTAVPVNVTVNDPYNAGSVLCTYNCPQFVVKSIDLSSTNKSDNTLKISGLDITGNMTVSYTTPQ
jgi:hypothetical protein